MLGQTFLFASSRLGVQASATRLACLLIGCRWLLVSQCKPLTQGQKRRRSTLWLAKVECPLFCPQEQAHIDNFYAGTSKSPTKGQSIDSIAAPGFGGTSKSARTAAASVDTDRQ
jgi:hypothetical protein